MVRRDGTDHDPLYGLSSFKTYFIFFFKGTFYPPKSTKLPLFSLKKGFTFLALNQLTQYVTPPTNHYFKYFFLLSSTNITAPTTSYSTHINSKSHLSTNHRPANPFFVSYATKIQTFLLLLYVQQENPPINRQSEGETRILNIS